MVTSSAWLLLGPAAAAPRRLRWSAVRSVRQLALEQGEEGDHVREIVAPVGGVVGRRRREAALAAGLDQRFQADEIHGFFEPLSDFHVDARVEVVGAIGMAEGHELRGQLSIARSPVTRGTGASPNVETNGSGSQTLSSSSIRSWSGVSGNPGTCWSTVASGRMKPSGT